MFLSLITKRGLGKTTLLFDLLERYRASARGRIPSIGLIVNIHEGSNTSGRILPPKHEPHEFSRIALLLENGTTLQH